MLPWYARLEQSRANQAAVADEFARRLLDREARIRDLESRLEKAERERDNEHAERLRLEEQEDAWTKRATDAEAQLSRRGTPPEVKLLAQGAYITVRADKQNMTAWLDGPLTEKDRYRIEEQVNSWLRAFWPPAPAKVDVEKLVEALVKVEDDKEDRRPRWQTVVAGVVVSDENPTRAPADEYADEFRVALRTALRAALGQAQIGGSSDADRGESTGACPDCRGTGEGD